MTIQQEDIARSPEIPNAQIVGLAFVKDYYNVLVASPQSLIKFYEDRRILNRPSLKGEILSLTTVIEQHITCRNHNRFKVEIKSVDSQASHNNGVLVMVSGSITFIDNATRSFTQTFFLAPRENGYFVWNDILRYVEEEAHQPEHKFSQTNCYPIEQYAAHADSVSEPVVKSEIESKVQTAVVEQPTTMAEEVHMRRKEVVSGSAGHSQKVSAIEHVHNQGQPTSTQETPAVFQYAPEKSQDLTVKEDAATQTVALRSAIRAVKDKSTAEESGCSIFVKNLPVHIRPRQVEEEFRKFGSIKPSGVQVRTIKERRFSYAFLEFEDPASAKAAIQASPIRIRERNVYISAKRPIADRKGLSDVGPITIPMAVKDVGEAIS